MVRKVAEDALHHFATAGDIGRKYLINHSAGSGKTLSICWLADRLHSLYKPAPVKSWWTSRVFILTDRKSLDTNIRDDIVKFTHLKDVIGLARRPTTCRASSRNERRSSSPPSRNSPGCSTRSENDPELKKLRVAFLIDEAHRSQEGQMGAAIRLPFRKAARTGRRRCPRRTRNDDEEKIAKVIREHDLNQLFVAFTATPAPATVQLFGEAFDTYTEAEAIAEGYIVDVAASIISYKTLYNLHCPVVPSRTRRSSTPRASCPRRSRMSLSGRRADPVQGRSDAAPLREGREAAHRRSRQGDDRGQSSRVAGLRYFEIIRKSSRSAAPTTRCSYAFSDFVHPTDERNADQ
jgi:type I restriction enzyme R subunit